MVDCLAEKLNPKGKGYIFNKDGGPLTLTAYRLRWNAYKKAIALAATPHQFRHAFTTILYEADVDEKSAQSMLGHSSIEVTRYIYTHLRARKRAEAASKLNKYIG